MGREETTPSVIRAALRGEVLGLLPEIVTIVLDDEEPAAARVRAFETIARYGLGVADMGQVVIEVAGDAHFGVVVMPALEQQRIVLAEGDGEEVEVVRELPPVHGEAIPQELSVEVVPQEEASGGAEEGTLAEEGAAEEGGPGERAV